MRVSLYVLLFIVSVTLCLLPLPSSLSTSVIIFGAVPHAHVVIHAWTRAHIAQT